MRLTKAIKQWTEVVGEEHVQSGPEATAFHERNLTEFDRRIPVVVSPGSLEELTAVVRVARDCGIPVSVVSQGKNWAQGSALPVQNDVVLLRLSRLNKVLEVNERLRYAIIEPGVTQGELAAHLKRQHPSLLFNMTGSGLDTSVVGNILERGAAMYGQRIHSLRSLEVMLTDGSLLHTGLWHFGGKHAHHYEHGLGPDLNGLFAQSNLGIVTKMVVNLRPRQEHELVCVLVNRDTVPALVEQLFTLRERQVITGGPVIVNRTDHRIRHTVSVSSEEDIWLAVLSLEGTERMREARRAELAEALAPLPAKIQYFLPNQADDPEILPFFRTMLKLLDGEPSNFSLEMFRRFLNPTAQNGEAVPDYDLDRDASAPGMSCVLPAVPFEGAAVDELIKVVREFSETSMFTVGFTFVTHDATTLEGFIRVIFDRANPEEVTAAHAWSLELYDVLRAHGFFPYRLHINAMDRFVDGESDVFWRTVGKLKQALDPELILSPGRYCPSYPARDTSA